MIQSARWKIGVKLADGTMRYCNMTNGGPVFVYVKDGKIIRITPIDFDDSDAAALDHRGARPQASRRRARPRSRRTARTTNRWSIRPTGCCYPMKRVDFDPNGERNPQNRGKSGYERISWDEALDIVAGEIKRLKSTYGPGVMAVSHGSHHTWGNIGYYLSALHRFKNAVGHTAVHHNPDSWEGWYWGAVHHWGYTLRVGAERDLRHGRGLSPELRDGRVLVGRSRDDERLLRRAGRHRAAPVAQEPQARHQDRPRRSLLQRLGAVPAGQVARAAPDHLGRDGDGDRLCLDQGRSLRQGVRRAATRSASTSGRPTSSARRTAWPRRRNGRRPRPACRRKDVRALAREWGKKRVYLAPGGWGNGHGGACRNQTGIQWARVMVCLIAMQGLGKPGVNMGNLQWGCPLDFNFYFPGYADGGMSGDLEGTSMPVELYQRMPQLPTMNTPYQRIPRIFMPEAIADGKAEGYPWVGKSIEHQFAQLRLSGARPRAGQDALQVRRLDPGDHEQHQPPCADVPVGEPRIRRQPVDLVRGRGEVRRRHPAGLHQFRARRHQRMGGPRRLRPSRPAAAEPPRHRVPGAGDRAAGRIEVRLPDLQRDLASASASPTISPRASTRSTG